MAGGFLIGVTLLILSSSAWGWLTDYAYRVKLQVDTSTAPTNYQMKVKVIKGSGTNDTSNAGARIYLNSHYLNWPYDIRLTNKQDVAVDFYREQWSSDGWVDSMLVWVEIPTFDTAYYLYYGKSGAADTSSGADTFSFFENFDNLNNWTLKNGTAGVSANVCSLVNDAGNNAWRQGLELTSNIPSDTLRKVSVDLYIQNTSGNRYVGYSAQSNNVTGSDSILHCSVRNETADSIRLHARTGNAWLTPHSEAQALAYQTWYNWKVCVSNSNVESWFGDVKKHNLTDSDWDRAWTKINLHVFSTTGKFRRIWVGKFRNPEPKWKTPGSEESPGVTAKKRIPDWITVDTREG